MGATTAPTTSETAEEDFTESQAGAQAIAASATSKEKGEEAGTITIPLPHSSSEARRARGRLWDSEAHPSLILWEPNTYRTSLETRRAQFCYPYIARNPQF